MSGARAGRGVGAGSAAPVAADEPPDPAAQPTLLGHAAAETALARAFAHGRLPTGLALVGPRGVGKATLAYRLARLALAHPDAAATGEPGHPVFRQIASGAHPDFVRLRRMADPKTRKLRREVVVDQVRDAVERLQQTAAAGGWRVLVADWADELNPEAANALLKMLEEPRPRTVMVLVVQRPGRLPRTILSRCALVRLRPLPSALLEQGLRHLAPDLDGPTLERVLPLAEGSLGRALELARGDLLERYADLLRAIVDGGPGARLAAAETLAQRSQKAGAEQGSEPLRLLLRRSARAQVGSTDVEIVPGEGPALARIGHALGLDRTLALWEKLAALAGRIDILNLDALQGFLPLVEEIATGREAA